MKRLTAMEVHARKVAELGLDPAAVDLTSNEAIANALRRAASFLCPCAAMTLVRAVVRPLLGLAVDLEAVKNLVEETLEAMTAHGDLLECREVGEDQGQGTRILLYAAPPSFVLRKSGTAILLGIASDQHSVLHDDLGARIEYVNHIRHLRPLLGENLREVLLQHGLIELSYDRWLKAPSAETPAEHVSRFNRLLDVAQPSGDIPGLLLLDPECSVRYYPRRWVEPRSQSGRFVARRSQAYGADLWCFVQVRDGYPERLIDLPTSGSRWRGCDEAWRLQMAIDSYRGEPQRFTVKPGPEGTHILEFFSPVPMWAKRRWDAVAEPVLASGCLFAYRISEDELREELQFANDTLWLNELTGSAQR